MKLICYPTSGERPKIIPAPLEREWMGGTPDAFAYRCLPLNIANGHGWLILNDAPFVAQWNGEAGLDAIQIEAVDAEGMNGLAGSHFGDGILTFHINALFRTEPEHDLWITGPSNAIKDGIQPLTGVVEADWSPATFTMNWRFTRAHSPVAFEHREPICMIFPMPRGLVETVEPEFHSLDSDPGVQAAYLEWAQSREAFNEQLHLEGSAAQRQKWQKDYFRGKFQNLSRSPASHRTKLKVRPFK